MTLQERTLKQYMELKGSPTLREIAHETGIDQTRVFRVMNGQKMRLDEWEIFQNLINNALGDLERLTKRCQEELSAYDLKEIAEKMRSKLDWNQLIVGALKCQGA